MLAAANRDRRTGLMPTIEIWCQNPQCNTNLSHYEYWQCHRCRLVACRPCWEAFTSHIRRNEAPGITAILKSITWDCPCTGGASNHYRLFPLGMPTIPARS
jgi:hypothetical protein